ncbi:MAG: PAS domain S-box protein [Lachnospiraceae bacterium]|nr:PAS domain S-box protein [Lachnospiraceae bacterium]
MSTYDSIIANMSEGLMTIGFDGFIKSANPAALKILGLEDVPVIGERFAALFFDDHEKDDFVQTILEAIYDKDRPHRNIVPYGVNGRQLHLRVMTSFYLQADERKGIIAVFSDLSELMELRDAVKSMEKIQALNQTLELRNKLLSETFGRYLSDDIVRQLLDSPNGLSLGGTKKELTIMMSDLRGFTAISERMKPAALISMLNHYLGAMTEIIQSYRGTIIEFIGDGIMAVFGAPTYFDTHAGEAIAAAVAMEKAMDEINDWNQKRGYPHLEMGIGLNTGEVIVGNIGSEKRTKYGIVGSQVNLCGRIESYTIGGQLLIAESTKNAADAVLEIAGTVTARPKGVEGEQTLYHVVGIGAPYNVSYEQISYEPVPIEKSVDVIFHMLKGKHEEGNGHAGKITAIGENCAVINTPKELQVYDNLEIELCGRLICKVMKKDDRDYLLRFTSIPPGFDEWKANL